MHLVCTIFLALVNGTSSKIENKAFKVFATIIFLCFVFVIAYIPAFFQGFEYYSLVGELGLGVSIDYLMFVSALTVPFLFNKNFNIDLNKGFSFWLIITYLFSLSLSAHVFT